MNLFGYDLQESVVFIIRIIATIGGAVVGWLAFDPLTRVAYRLSFRAATPGGLLFCGKAVGGAALALAVWFAWPEGGGGGGPGFGPGNGGLPSKGGPGGEKTSPGESAKTPDAKQKIDAKDKSPGLEPVDIEIINGNLFEKLFKEDGKERWFVIKQKPYTVAELDEYLKKNHGKIEVTPVLTKESIGIGREDNPLDQLLALTKKYHVKTLQRKEL